MAAAHAAWIRRTDGGAGHWATIASLVETAKLNGVDPQAYLADVMALSSPQFFAKPRNHMQQGRSTPQSYRP
jgi:hypothetical protein